MAGYIYLPVPTPEMIGEAKLWREGQADKGETPNGLLYNFEKGFRKGFVRNFCGGVLRNVVATDKLYVLCHGETPRVVPPSGPTVAPNTMSSEDRQRNGLAEWTKATRRASWRP